MKKELLIRAVRVFVGFVILAIGTVTIYQGNIGLGAWDVLHDGIAKTLDMSFGNASIVVGLAVLSIGIIAREKLGVATILNILIIGKVIDFIMNLGIIPQAPNYFMGVVMSLLGSAILTFGIYFYISPGLGAGPRDTFLTFATKKTGIPVGYCRMVIELIAVLVGFLLGGKVGVGTILIALVSGPIMQLEFKLLKFNIKEVKHLGIDEFFKILIQGKLYTRVAAALSKKFPKGKLF